MEMYCVRRSCAPRVPRLGKSWYTHIYVCHGRGKLRHPCGLDGMVWDGMGWDGMVTCRDGIGRDGMRWDGMYVRRSCAAGVPRLGKGWHTQIHVRPGLGRMRHPSRRDGMGWDGMGWDGDLTGWDWKGLMRWDGMYCVRWSCAARVPRLGKCWHTQI